MANLYLPYLQYFIFIWCLYITFEQFNASLLNISINFQLIRSNNTILTDPKFLNGSVSQLFPAHIK